MDGELLDDVGRLEELRADWERLVDSAGRPFAAPSWSVAWWRHAAPEGARLRVAIAREAGRLAAVAPFFAVRSTVGLTTLAPLASGTSYRGEPVGVAGSERAAGRVLASVLADSGAHVIRFEGVSESSPWPAALAAGWPGRLVRQDSMPAPFVSLSSDDAEAWLRSRSANFRSALRRHVKRGDAAGASVRRLVDVDEARHGVSELVRLHHARWTPRGGSGVIDDRIEAMLVDAVEELLAYDRLRLYVFELDGRILGADLFLSAGGEIAYWLGGFDDAAARFAPSIRNIHAAVAEAIERRDRRVDLGGGGQEYKYRFADGEERLAWWILVPRGRSGLGVRARLLPGRASAGLRRRLTPRQKALLRRIARR